MEGAPRPRIVHSNEGGIDGLQDTYAERLGKIDTETLQDSGQAILASLLTLKGKWAGGNSTKLDLIFDERLPWNITPGSLRYIYEGVNSQNVIKLREAIAEFNNIVGYTSDIKERANEIAEMIAALENTDEDDSIPKAA